ncbi:MAG: CHAT domain-containing protein [Acidobacteria bacterium]|nr:CHAT domain-containing protein [Acidobacteriota bacterium]MSO83675.1 CHAT domain-containing protein [Acidobacteriota bacterium]
MGHQTRRHRDCSLRTYAVGRGPAGRPTTGRDPTRGAHTGRERRPIQPNHSPDLQAIAGGLEAGRGTGPRLIAEAAGRRVIHVAAQTASNPTHPMLSRVHLSDEPGRHYSGAMLGRDIAKLALPDTKVVVIDEVETNGNTRGDGTLTLSRAFMSAGISAVDSALGVRWCCTAPIDRPPTSGVRYESSSVCQPSFARRRRLYHHCASVAGRHPVWTAQRPIRRHDDLHGAG